MTEEVLKLIFRHGNKLCLGLPEETYKFTEYLSSHLILSPSPFGVAMSILFAIGDVKEGIHRDYRGTSPLPTYLRDNQARVIARAPFVIQLLDFACEDEEFAASTHHQFEECYGAQIPHRVRIPRDEDEAFYQTLFDDRTKRAVEWWCGIIQLQSYHLFTVEDIRAFRGTLALKIANELKMYDYVELGTDDHPSRLLTEAAEAAGVAHSELPYIFPANTQMFVDESVQIIHSNRTPFTLCKFIPAAVC